MATNPELNIKIKTTWVKNASLFVCRYIKLKWLLRILARLTIAKVYCEGKLISKVKLGEYLPKF
jgi:hypothetical protein